jgi:uncharacterized protein (UPF0276 family)
VDRFGFGFRPEISTGILTNLDKIDILEVVIDDYLDFPKKKIDSLKFLSSQIPLTFHGIQLGLASTIPVSEKRLAKFARVIDKLKPEYWSEHLAFVRGIDVEIHHLAAPPRNQNTLNGTLENLHKAKKVIGASPYMENTATLIHPPGNNWMEKEWIEKILSSSEVNLLLDLHNLYANSVNFSFDPIDFIYSIPENRIRTVHIAGGKWVGKEGSKRILDTHFHPVPDPVYDLLFVLGKHVKGDLDIILERDGHYPPFAILLEELQRARTALREGRKASENELASV